MGGTLNNSILGHIKAQTINIRYLTLLVMVRVRGWHGFRYAEGTRGKPVKKLAGKFTRTRGSPAPKIPYG